MKTTMKVNPHIVTKAIRSLPLVEQLVTRASPHPTTCSPNANYERDRQALADIIALVRAVRKGSDYDHA
jgi:hypothetical protein